MKKIVAIILVIAMVFSFAACNTSEEQPVVTQVPEVVTPAPATAVPTVVPTAEPTVSPTEAPSDTYSIWDYISLGSGSSSSGSSPTVTEDPTETPTVTEDPTETPSTSPEPDENTYEWDGTTALSDSDVSSVYTYTGESDLESSPDFYGTLNIDGDYEEITIDMVNATVNFNGTADTAIVSTADTSFHVYGTIGEVKAYAGSIYVEDGGSVSLLYVASANVTTVSVPSETVIKLAAGVNPSIVMGEESILDLIPVEIFGEVTIEYDSESEAYAITGEMEYEGLIFVGTIVLSDKSVELCSGAVFGYEDQTVALPYGIIATYYRDGDDVVIDFVVMDGEDIAFELAQVADLKITLKDGLAISGTILESVYFSVAVSDDIGYEDGTLKGDFSLEIGGAYIPVKLIDGEIILTEDFAIDEIDMVIQSGSKVAIVDGNAYITGTVTVSGVVATVESLYVSTADKTLNGTLIVAGDAFGELIAPVVKEYAGDVDVLVTSAEIQLIGVGYNKSTILTGEIAVVSVMGYIYLRNLVNPLDLADEDGGYIAVIDLSTLIPLEYTFEKDAAVVVDGFVATFKAGSFVKYSEGEIFYTGDINFYAENATEITVSIVNNEITAIAGTYIGETITIADVALDSETQEYIIAALEEIQGSVDVETFEAIEDYLNTSIETLELFIDLEEYGIVYNGINIATAGDDLQALIDSIDIDAAQSEYDTAYAAYELAEAAYYEAIDDFAAYENAATIVEYAGYVEANAAYQAEINEWEAEDAQTALDVAEAKAALVDNMDTVVAGWINDKYVTKGTSFPTNLVYCNVDSSATDYDKYSAYYEEVAGETTGFDTAILLIANGASASTTFDLTTSIAGNVANIALNEGYIAANDLLIEGLYAEESEYPTVEEIAAAKELIAACEESPAAADYAEAEAALDAANDKLTVCNSLSSLSEYSTEMLASAYAIEEAYAFYMEIDEIIVHIERQDVLLSFTLENGAEYAASEDGILLPVSISILGYKSFTIPEFDIDELSNLAADVDFDSILGDDFDAEALIEDAISGVFNSLLQ